MISFKPSLIILAALVFTSCSTTQNINIEENSTAQATLWVQNSAEYKAIAIQTYSTASRMLSLPLEDSYWTASLNQEESDGYRSLPPAIILDIDETILDNSPFQARMIKQDKTFNIDDWNAWCNEGKADGIPGAVDFTNYAAEKNIAIFYISNRGFEVEEATRRNLIEEGFPVSDTQDNIMTNGEEPGWNSSKIKRRQIIEENYRVLMIFGDDLNDFLPAKDISQEERDSIVERYSEYFGRRWFMLPNLVYGSWDQALFDFESDLSEEERTKILNKRLDTKN
ncbi:MAG: HAD family acid phosphatase [Balneolaceae bacterium]